VNLKTKVILFVAVAALAYGVDSYWTVVAQPTVSAHVAVQQMGNTTYGAENTRAMDAYQGLIHMGSVIGVVMVGVLMFWDNLVSVLTPKGDQE